MDRKAIEKFIEITGESEATAHRYLLLVDGSVELAISLMFEAGQTQESEHVEPEQIEPEEIVRPPILPTQEILVPSEPVYAFPRLSNDIFDRFRDFAVETQRQEEEMTHRVTGVKHISQRKSKRLEDLFRPPHDILFLGTFIEAREHAKSLNRWLLVNVQNPQEFICQVLNRDVWPNQQIQEIVKDHFVLWQVLSNTTDGKRYIDFYNVINYPYVAIVDPRTGECMQTYNRVTVDSLISDLNDMLSIHASPENAPQDIYNSHKTSNSSISSLKRNSSSSFVKNDYGSSSKDFECLVERSVKSDDCKFGDNSNNVRADSDSLNILNKRKNLSDMESKTEHTKVTNLKIEQLKKTHLDENKTDINEEPSLRLCLRLPNGRKETISMSAMNTIEDFLKRMENMGYPPSEHTYLIPFPKTNIGALPRKICLMETILFPSNTIFITEI